MGGMISDEIMHTAMLNHLLHHVRFFSLNSDSYQVTQSRQKKRRRRR